MAVAITRTADPVGVTADGSNNANYSAASIGTASDDRVVWLLIGKEVATLTPGAVTIDGSAMALVNGNTFGSMGAWIYRRNWPTGTTANFVVPWGGAITNVQNHVAVYITTDAKAPEKSNGNNTSTDMDATAPLTTGSVTIPTGGGMLAVAVGATDAVGKTWANITEDLDEDAGNFQFGTASTLTPGTVTVTCTGGTNLEDGAMAWAIFEQSSSPLNLSMPPPAIIARRQ